MAHLTYYQAPTFPHMFSLYFPMWTASPILENSQSSNNYILFFLLCLLAYLDFPHVFQITLRKLAVELCLSLKACNQKYISVDNPNFFHCSLFIFNERKLAPKNISTIHTLFVHTHIRFLFDALDTCCSHPQTFSAILFSFDALCLSILVHKGLLPKTQDLFFWDFQSKENCAFPILDKRLAGSPIQMKATWLAITSINLHTIAKEKNPILTVTI